MGGTSIQDPARLTALRATGLLDGEAHADLGCITELATQLLGVPVSHVSLVEHDRQFLAACTGMPEPWARARETPLSHSLCRHVVERDAPLVIADAREHPLVADNLAVRDLGVVAYAGVPLHVESGTPIGALCAIDRVPREWSEADLHALSGMARITSKLIELHGIRTAGAFHDPVTGLPGRTLFDALVGQGLKRAASEGGQAALVALDLDGFRLINQALGHGTGDALLDQVGERLRAALRGSDIVCRLAGDEFAVFCPSVTDEADALRIADRLVNRISRESFYVDGRPQSITASAGIVVAEGPGDPRDLELAAFARLRASKPTGGATAAAARDQAEARLRLRNEVGRAHRRGEMVLAYQPIVALSENRIWGYEALLRWNHPELGPIAPDVFIPAAEESGAIVDIGEWVLEQACEDAARWRRLPGAEDLQITVNVAPAQIGIPIFAQSVVATILDATGVPASALTLEITERTLLVDRPVHRATLQQLQELGVHIALDDFGTGYSALSYLTRFPLDELKIDRSFVDLLRHDGASASIVEGIVAMAQTLGLHTVAEGIEEESQREWLARLGCDLGQGYLFSRPVRAELVDAHLEAKGTRL